MKNIWGRILFKFRAGIVLFTDFIWTSNKLNVHKII